MYRTLSEQLICVPPPHTPTHRHTLPYVSFVDGLGGTSEWHLEFNISISKWCFVGKGLNFF